MKEKLFVHFDEEGDFLELRLGRPAKGYFKDLGRDIFERIDEETGKAVGIAIFNFKKRTAKKEDIEVDLPVKMEFAAS